MKTIEQIALEAVRAESLQQIEQPILDYIAQTPQKRANTGEIGLADASGILTSDSVALILFEKYCRIWMKYHPHTPVAEGVKEFLVNYGTWNRKLKETAIWRSCRQMGAPAEQIPEIENFAASIVSYSGNKC